MEYLMREQTRGEEIANSITHGIGTLLSVAALVLLLISATASGDVWRITSLSIYGTTLILLYLSSTLFHSLTDPRLKRIFEIVDRSCIYLLIAGTYTPVLLVSLRGPWGWTLFGLNWGFAVIGVLFESTTRIKNHELIAVFIYIAMGWLIVVALEPLLQAAPIQLLIWILVGGISYTLGTVFFLWQRLPFHHAIWHVFVMIGSLTHFLGLFFYIAST